MFLGVIFFDIYSSPWPCNELNVSRHILYLTLGVFEPFVISEYGILVTRSKEYYSNQYGSGPECVSVSLYSVDQEFFRFFRCYIVAHRLPDI